MDEKIFKARTKKLAVAIIKQMDKLPQSRAADVVARQVIRSGTSFRRTTVLRVAQSPQPI